LADIHSAGTGGFRLAQAPPEYQMRFGATHVLLSTGQGVLPPMSPPAGGVHTPPPTQQQQQPQHLPHQAFHTMQQQQQQQQQLQLQQLLMHSYQQAQHNHHLQQHVLSPGSLRLPSGHIVTPMSPSPSAIASAMAMAPPMHTPSGRPFPSDLDGVVDDSGYGIVGKGAAAVAPAVDRTPPRSATPTTQEDEQTPSRPSKQYPHPQLQQVAAGANDGMEGRRSRALSTGAASPAGPVAGVKRGRSDSTSLELMFQAIDEVEASSSLASTSPPASRAKFGPGLTVPVPRLADSTVATTASLDGKGTRVSGGSALPSVPSSPSKFVAVADKQAPSTISRRLVLST